MTIQHHAILFAALFLYTSSFAQNESPTPTETPKPLNLETSLQDAPLADVIERALRSSVKSDPSWLPRFGGVYPPNLYRGYKYGVVTNTVKRAKITNEYTRTVEGEVIFVFDFALDVEIVAALGETMESPNHEFSIGIVRRGKKW